MAYTFYKSIFFVLSWEITITPMKNNAYSVVILAICCFVLFASSCRTDKPEVPVQPKSDVTVMIYGSGGGSLDRSMITLNTLHQGIRNAGVRLDAIYLDCCLMNCLEYQFGLKDLCDYIVASTYVQTAFDQAVGWSRWLMLNHHEPSMWSKSGFEEELDDDDL